MTVLHGDCLEVMPTLDADSVDAIVTDPPYGLSFMGKQWDHGVPGEPFWREALRVAKPGAHLLAFGGTRTYHRLAVAIEDAGWEIRDCLSWLYGSGFPKSHDVSKAIDKVNGETDRLHRFTAWMRTTGITTTRINEATGTFMGSHYLNAGSQPAIPTPDLWAKLRPLCGDVPAWVDELVKRIEAEREVVGVQKNAMSGWRMDGGTQFKDRKITAPSTEAAQQWQGWGTALKPAWEPIILARKPLVGTVAANVTQHGTGGLNVDGCRIAFSSDADREAARVNGLGPVERAKFSRPIYDGGRQNAGFAQTHNPSGRWPANVVLDEDAAGMLDEQAGERGGFGKASGPTLTGESTSRSRGKFNGVADTPFYGDSGGPSRFFYTAKASRREREAGCDTNGHPTVKPIAVMRWLCRLVTPPNGLILDPFTGSGTTGCAAVLEGFRFVGIEREAEYVEIATKRIAHWQESTLFSEAV